MIGDIMNIHHITATGFSIADVTERVQETYNAWAANKSIVDIQSHVLLQGNKFVYVLVISYINPQSIEVLKDTTEILKDFEDKIIRADTRLESYEYR